jgi:glutathione S-transferase
MMWIRSDLMPLREERSTETMFYDRAQKPLSAAAQASAESLVRVVGAVLPEGKTQLFSNWSIADADLAFCLQRLGLNGYTLPEGLQAFVDAQWARPSIQAFVTHPRG